MNGDPQSSIHKYSDESGQAFKNQEFWIPIYDIGSGSSHGWPEKNPKPREKKSRKPNQKFGFLVITLLLIKLDFLMSFETVEI